MRSARKCQTRHENVISVPASALSGRPASSPGAPQRSAGRHAASMPSAFMQENVEKHREIRLFRKKGKKPRKATPPGALRRSAVKKSARSGDLAFCLNQMVGAAGFELATPCTPCKCATRLRHAPTSCALYRLQWRCASLFCIVPCSFCALQPPWSSIPYFFSSRRMASA